MVRVVDKGNGKADVVFTISMPMDVYENFTNTCQKEYGNCFWIYIKDLMVISESFNVLTSYDDRYTTLKTEIDELKDKIGNIGKVDTDSIRTLGE